MKNLLLIFTAFFLITSLQAKEYSPAVGKDYPTKLLWGDTHLHTNESADAWSIGNPNLTPSDAFRFARGEEVISESGVKAKLRVPLDFFMVSKFIGIHPIFLIEIYLLNAVHNNW